ncbi:CYFA0S36e00606g1_1 [Cyberlindnera fabianii]|uniref:CYFA0S36e00606g1_1 n=1 Tax=Cyberlindnera fabianii TaxID=36022 RepID=A0A061BIJ1_CYBFA|nr:Sulfate permease 1 [Cyberlindnera fabianii]CDR47703.1 CYFA0S36e00606g1_1 [Cyberlindnera fabianii]
MPEFSSEDSGSSSNQRDIYELYEQHRGNEDDTFPLYAYHEEETNSLTWIKNLFHHPKERAISYLSSIFPIIHWIAHYNFAWLYADFVAGVTVGIVMVPQAMSYAQIAGLEAQYGLYSAFVGVFIYCFFATSKDVSIGPVAVMSLEVSKVIHRVQEKDPSFSAPVIATALSFVCGCITIGLGLLRLGFILEFISSPAVVGFMTGSALNIISGQVPALMGYNKRVNTRDSTYKVIINTLKNLPHTKLDAVFGLIPLVILYTWRWTCNAGPKRYPKLKQPFFYGQALRSGVVIIVFTAISYAITRHHKKDPRISILGKVPSGLRDVGLMSLPDGILSTMASELPAAVIILCLEHISISKSFGRVNDYKIVPDQELIAIGATNLIGTFFNAYPATGSFSRSALKAKCNVKTPLAGIFTGACVLLGLYCLTGAFYYIPKATLSAVIIHAVSDLMASYHVTWNFWKVAPFDAGIFIICVFICVFSSIENGIYFAICASVAVLLLNVVFPNGTFLGRVKIAEAVNPRIIETGGDDNSLTEDVHEVIYEQDADKKTVDLEEKKKSKKRDVNYHTIWVPFKNTVNSDIEIIPPPPGVLVFRPSDSWTYINASRQFEKILDEVKRTTRKGKKVQITKNIDKPWNDPGPLVLPWTKKSTILEREAAKPADERPLLKIIAFDFSTVAQVDSTSIQTLVDLRKAINKYADREVEFHFCGILSPWIKRALIAAGFGISKDSTSRFNYVDLVRDDESHLGYAAGASTDTPFFHLEIPSFAKYDEYVEEQPRDDDDEF